MRKLLVIYSILKLQQTFDSTVIKNCIKIEILGTKFWISIKSIKYPLGKILTRNSKYLAPGASEVKSRVKADLLFQIGKSTRVHPLDWDKFSKYGTYHECKDSKIFLFINHSMTSMIATPTIKNIPTRHKYLI